MTIQEQYENLVKTIRGYNPAADFQHIQAAYEFAREAHKDQKRKSGEPYITHPLAVAQIVAEELRLDSESIEAALLHDVIEIDAGDTYAYDTEGNKTKRERELKAADRIFGLLPDAQRMEYRGLWDEFEAMKTAEAKFANMLDKVQPLLLNNASDGKSWVEHGVKESQVLARNSRTHEGSEELWAYAKSLIEENVKKGRLQP